MTTPNSDSNTYFAQVADQWDEIRSGYFTEHMRDAAIAKANLPANAVVADVGTGTGFVAHGLVERASQVIGFDANPDMLAVARRNLSNFDNVEFREAAGDQLPVADETFDGVFANMFLHHAPDPARTIKELARTLKPNGVLCITDLDTTIMNGSASKWPICGWALSAMTFASGTQKQDYVTSM